MLWPMAERTARYLAEQLVLKITLDGSEPKIWRRVEVHSGLTLHDLHFVIQNVFEWENSHLYQFIVTPQGKLTQRAMREARYYHVMPSDPVFDTFRSNDRRADQALLAQIFRDDVRQMIYEYDFGDSWKHLIKLEKRTVGGDQDHVPVCLAGENAAPLDDMGGIPGYYQWIDALRDKNSAVREQAIGLLGADFDQGRFDLAEVNWRLSKAFKQAPKKPRKRRKKRE
jgi:hypothetical protein